MEKPLIFRAIYLLERLLGRARFSSLVRSWFTFSLDYSQDGKNARSVLRRILAHRGETTNEERLAPMVRRCGELFADSMVTLFTLDRAEAELLAMNVDLDLMPVLRGLLGQGKGVILAGPHFGNQVAAMSALCLAGIPLHAQFVNAQPYEWGSVVGLRVMDLGFGAAQCVRALKENEVLLLYTDLDFFPQGRTADFFGAPIRPPHGPARLSLYCSAPILPFYPVFREGRHHVQCGEPIFPEGRTQEELEAGILRSMESFIGKNPEQWFVGKDIWDIEGTDQGNRRHLRILNVVRQLERLVFRRRSES